MTVHIGVGYDIVHEHPNCDGAAYGQTSYADFLTFAALVERIENGVVMNFGSAVMAPKVFLKALAMALASLQEDRAIADFDARHRPSRSARRRSHLAREQERRLLLPSTEDDAGAGGGGRGARATTSRATMPSRSHGSGPR